MNISIPTLPGTTPAMTVNGWIIFQQRLDTSLIWSRNWTDYRDGFGSLGGNYWMGNEKVHLLTQAGTNYRLRIEMLFTAYGWMSAEYDQFSLDNETDSYRLHVMGYSNGECGDSVLFEGDGGIKYLDGASFATFDSEYSNCPDVYQTGWWFNGCYWALMQSDTPVFIGWGTVEQPTVTQSRMMIKTH